MSDAPMAPQRPWWLRWWVIVLATVAGAIIAGVVGLYSIRAAGRAQLRAQLDAWSAAGLPTTWEQVLADVPAADPELARRWLALCLQLTIRHDSDVLCDLGLGILIYEKSTRLWRPSGELEWDGLELWRFWPVSYHQGCKETENEWIIDRDQMEGRDLVIEADRILDQNVSALTFLALVDRVKVSGPVDMRDLRRLKEDFDDLWSVQHLGHMRFADAFTTQELQPQRLQESLKRNRYLRKVLRNGAVPWFDANDQDIAIWHAGLVLHAYAERVITIESALENLVDSELWPTHLRRWRNGLFQYAALGRSLCGTEEQDILNQISDSSGRSRHPVVQSLRCFG